LLYIPANLLPIMTAKRVLEGGPVTILEGVRELIRDGSWFLAIVVFLASIAVPLLKLAVLSVLLIMTVSGSPRGLITRTRLFRVIEVLGRWSMLDIFVLSMLVGVVRLGVLGYVRPEPGALAFCAVVVVTMLATEVFDPKSMWDAAGKNERGGSRVQVGGTP
jgi:paraquat-inducible protein A